MHHMAEEVSSPLHPPGEKAQFVTGFLITQIFAYSTQAPFEIAHRLMGCLKPGLFDEHHDPGVADVSIENVVKVPTTAIQLVPR